MEGLSPEGGTTELDGEREKHDGGGCCRSLERRRRRRRRRRRMLTRKRASHVILLLGRRHYAPGLGLCFLHLLLVPLPHLLARLPASGCGHPPSSLACRWRACCLGGNRSFFTLGFGYRWSVVVR